MRVPGGVQRIVRTAEAGKHPRWQKACGREPGILCACRSRVILALPGLKALDGRPVTDEERAAAPGELAAEEATVAVLMRNACEVHNMVGAGPAPKAGRN